MPQTILITGASSGFGFLISKALAQAGHHVFASMREHNTRNAEAAANLRAFSQGVDGNIIPITIDVCDADSISHAVAFVTAQCDTLDVIIHNAGHMAFGPAEAFSPAQYARAYDINVIGAQRINQAVLPLLREQRSGLVLWISSSSCTGGTPPYLAPYFAAKAAMDALAVQYARELAPWGIESSIIVPGAFTQGTNHFASADEPADRATLNAYEQGPTAQLAQRISAGFTAIVPSDAHPQSVANAVTEVVNTPGGKRPFRVHVDPVRDGAEEAFGVIDRLREDMLRRMDLHDLCGVTTTTVLSETTHDS